MLLLPAVTHLVELLVHWLTLGSRFGAVRFGVRFNGLNDIDYARWVLEVGPGVW